MKKLKLLFIFLFLFSIGNFLSAATTGKISGKVTDADTGEPLPGINVFIEGTSMGAATDIDGKFVINNIPPGTYSVIASGVGFQRKEFQNLKVSVDFTTQLNFQMGTEAIEVETIVVQAEAPMIRKDLTSSRTSVDATEIESLPVENISELLTLQAGITQGAGGDLHIRGGRSNEIAYTVNGVSISNPFDNTRTVQIATNAIQELSVVSGTFNAEYGNALSGVVNTVTKEGGSDYNGYVSFYSGDHLSSRDETFFNVDEVDPLNNYVAEATLGGPIPFSGKKVTFFASGRYDNDRGWLFGKRQHTVFDSVFKSTSNPDDIRISSTGDGAIVPMNPSEEYSGTVKFTVRPFKAVKVNYDVLYSNSEYQTYNHALKYVPDANYTRYEWGLLNSLEVSHALNSKTFYNVKASYNLNDYKRYLYPLLDSDGNPVDYYPGLNVNDYYIDQRYQPSHKTVRPGPAAYTFRAGGTENGHFYQRSATLSGKFDLTSQVTTEHEVKFGASIRSHNMQFEDFEIKRDTVVFLEPTIQDLSNTSHDKYTKEPLEISAYLQDKMEFDNLIMNIGVRYDYFDAKSPYAIDDFNPTPENPNLPSGIDPNSLLVNNKVKHKISPRIGVSFPITDKGIIHFSYGHFYQMPPFSYLYANPDFKYVLDQTPYGNANLNPQKTVSYEIGLQQQLNDATAFNITGFYKDVRDLLATQRIRISGSETYTKYVNKDYGNIKGVTFSLTKRRTASDLFGATLDYTFQVAEGNDTDPDAFFIDLASGRQPEKIPVYLDWDQTHTLNMSASVGRLGNWNVSLTGRLGTGLPYTPQFTENQVFLRANSARRPSTLTFDLLAEKTLDLFGFNLTVFAKVFNLFDNLNERFVYDDTGRATYSLDQKRPTGIAVDKLAERIEGMHTVDDYFTRPNYYSAPREVRLGMSFEF